MSINVVVTDNFGNIIPTGAQYIYTKLKLYESDIIYTPVNRTPLSKQSSQYIYTNDNPLSMLALDDDGSSSNPGTNVIYLMSGARNNTETKVFIGPRSVDYIKMELYTEDESIKATFSGEDFENLVNNNKDKFISIIYTQLANQSSYEMDLHTDMTSYDEATDYSTLDYLGVHNYPHFNQIKYSDRIVSNDDFISNSMAINASIEYTPHFGNYYIRPDFVKGFKGFKILGKNNAYITLSGTDEIEVPESSSEIVRTITATLSNVYYEELTWDYSPKVPGIKLVPSNDTKSAELIIDPDVLRDHDLYKSTITISVYSLDAPTVNKTIELTVPQIESSDSAEVDIYVVNPNEDPNPWYNLLDYITLDYPYRFRADDYKIECESNNLLIDESNYRFRYVGNYEDNQNDSIDFGTQPGSENSEFNNQGYDLLDYGSTPDATIKLSYTPNGFSSAYGETTFNIYKFDNNLTRVGTYINSHLRVREWVECTDSKLSIISSDSSSCTLSGSSGFAAIKAITDHGIYLYREML